MRPVRFSLHHRRQILRHKCVAPTVPCLCHNPRRIVASDGPIPRPWTPISGRACSSNTSENAIKTRKRSFASACVNCKPPWDAKPSPLDIMVERNADGLAAGVRSHPISHFSAVLHQHYPQVVKINLYQSSAANSRREFLSETRKSSGESDDEDALQFARGSSE